MINRIIGVVLILIALVVGLQLAFPRYSVPSRAMEPTIPAGSQVFMRRTKAIVRGDLVVFRYSRDPKVTWVKRLIALPGESVEIRDKHVFINGRALVEPYAVHTDPSTYPKVDTLPEPYRSRDQFGPLVVPANAYFVLGDNRDQSNDSRYVGPVPRDDVRGVIFLGVNLTRGFWRLSRQAHSRRS